MNEVLPANMRRAYSSLGEDVILIPVPAKTKATRMTTWQELRLAETKHEDYIRGFGAGSNVGVVLGPNSGNLCSIDIDSDQALAEFVKLNPWAASTLLTKGNRGANYWVRIEGDYPKLTPIAGWGEWRSRGAYTVFSGLHPNGMPYQLVQDFKPIVIRFSDIAWPQKVRDATAGKWADFCPPPLHTHSSGDCIAVTSKPEPLPTVSLRPERLDTGNCVTSQTQEIVGKLGQFEETERRLAAWKASIENKSLVSLYEIQIERYFRGEPHGRNQFIVDSGTRLFYALSDDVALSLMGAFYEIHSILFTDSYEKHMKDAAGIEVTAEN